MEASLAEGETKTTPISLCNHSYFNLAGHDAAEGILEQSLQILADAYTPTDE